MLADGDVAMASVGCSGTNAGARMTTALNADDILDFSVETVRTSATMRNVLDIYTSPAACGEAVAVIILRSPPRAALTSSFRRLL